MKVQKITVSVILILTILGIICVDLLLIGDFSMILLFEMFLILSIIYMFRILMLKSITVYVPHVIIIALVLDLFALFRNTFILFFVYSIL